MCEIMLIELMFTKTNTKWHQSYSENLELQKNAMKYMRESLHQNIH